MFSLRAYKLSKGGAKNAAINQVVKECSGVVVAIHSERVDRNFSRPPSHQSCGAAQIAVSEYWPSNGFSNLRNGKRGNKVTRRTVAIHGHKPASHVTCLPACGPYS